MVFTEGVAVLTCFADTIFVRYKKSIWNFCAFVNITSNKYVGNLLDLTNIYLEHYSNKEDDDVLSVLELLHPAPHSHLDHLETGAVDLLDQAQDRGEHVGVLDKRDRVVTDKMIKIVLPCFWV